MQVFISWSGDRSRALATVLREYLPLVIQSVSPWFSPDDIDKGSRWLGDLTDQLHKQSVAIVCVTPESVNSPWLLFEAGALSKALDASWVCPVLLGIEPSDIKGPLAQFQSTKVSKEDIRKLLGTLNKRLEPPLGDSQIDRVHDALWGEYEKRIREIAANAAPTSTPHRSQGDILVEVLERVRGLERRLAEQQQTPQLVGFDATRRRATIDALFAKPTAAAGTADISMKLARFQELYEASNKRLQELQATARASAEGSPEHAAALASAKQELQRLRQYENEIGRMSVKLKRAQAR